MDSNHIIENPDILDGMSREVCTGKMPPDIPETAARMPKEVEKRSYTPWSDPPGTPHFQVRKPIASAVDDRPPAFSKGSAEALFLSKPKQRRGTRRTRVDQNGSPELLPRLVNITRPLGTMEAWSQAQDRLDESSDELDLRPRGLRPVFKPNKILFGTKDSDTASTLRLSPLPIEIRVDSPPIENLSGDELSMLLSPPFIPVSPINRLEIRAAARVRVEIESYSDELNMLESPPFTSVSPLRRSEIRAATLGRARRDSLATTAVDSLATTVVDSLDESTSEVVALHRYPRSTESSPNVTILRHSPDSMCSNPSAHRILDDSDEFCLSPESITPERPLTPGRPPAPEMFQTSERPSTPIRPISPQIPSRPQRPQPHRVALPHRPARDAYF